jgi:hypothetical protein
MAFVGVELYQISDARLLAGHIGRQLTRDLAPERVHQGVRVGVERPRLISQGPLHRPGAAFGAPRSSIDVTRRSGFR